MSFAAYIRQNVFDMVLCMCASASLCYSCLIAFLSTLSYLDQPLPVIGFCMALTAVLFVVAYNLRTALVGSVVLAGVVIGVAVASWAGSGAASIFDDVAGNNVYLVIEVVLSCLAVFLLSRKKVGCAVLLVGGLLMCCVMEYLYWNYRLVPAVLFAVCVAALFALRNYRQGLKGSDTERVQFGATAVVAGAVGCASVLLALGVFALFIAPLEPEGLVVKLITHRVQVQEIEVRGTGDQVSLLTQLLQSLNALGSVDAPAGSDSADEQEASSEDQEQEEEQEQDAGGSSFGLDRTGEDTANPLSMFEPSYVAALAALAIVLLVALAIWLRKMLRRRTYKRIRSLPGVDQVRAFYLYFTNAFSKMRISRPESATLREYMESASGVYASFEKTDSAADEPAFAKLTETYARCTYGQVMPSDEDVSSFDDYYRKFHKMAAGYVGRLKYVPLFFKI